MLLEAPPPARHISSAPISQHAASSMLDTYLRNSESHPHLHPDAIITPSGVTASSHGGAHGGVVMHNLRRVAAGLRGEYLEPEATPEPEEEGPGAEAARRNKGKGKRVQSEWQNVETAALQEDGFDMGQRTNGVVEGEVPEAHASNGEADESVKKRKQEDGTITKEQRKKAKKEREQKRKRDNQQQRAKKADSEIV